MIYVSSFFFAIPSPLFFFFFNAEVWTVTMVLTTDASPLGIAACVAAGQLVGYHLVFFKGPWLLDRFPFLRRRLEKLDASRYEKLGYLGLITGGILNFPPAIGLTFLRVPLRFRYVIWLPLVIISRFGRFAIIASLPDVFADVFKVQK